MEAIIEVKTFSILFWCIALSWKLIQHGIEIIHTQIINRNMTTDCSEITQFSEN